MIQNSDIKNAVNKREIYRYMGYGQNEPDDSVRALADEVLEELILQIQPKSIYRIYECDISGCGASADVIRLGDMEIKSRGLAGNLAQCKLAAVMAATLGIEADKLLQRYEVTNMAKASVAQACGAACIEAYCDLLQEEILQAAQKKHGGKLYLRPRFSPGYGDLPLETQSQIFAALDCTKRIGLTLTQSLLMYPTKSVTAFIGLTRNPASCHIESCESCAKTDCEFRYSKNF